MMVARMLVEALLVLHLLFIVFAVAGGFLVLRWPLLVWLHIPAAVWAALIALVGGICPLTELENSLRHGAGMAGYPDGFVGSLLIPIIYPHGLTRFLQIMLGVSVIGLNGVAYGLLLKRRMRSRRRP